MGMRDRLRKLGKLEREAGRSAAAGQGVWSDEAARRLTDRELALLANALQRETDAGLDDDAEFPQLRVGPEEKAALDRFCRFYEEARRGA